MFSKLVAVLVSVAAVSTATPAYSASAVAPPSTASAAVPASTAASGQNTTDICAFGTGGFHQGSGTPWCCKTIQDARSPAAQQELGSVKPAPPRAANTIYNFIGVGCTPMNVPASFDSNIKFECDSNPVCCRNNSFSGVVALGCTTVTLEF